MANTISNVLAGVATLAIREPNDAIAEWSTTQQYAGSWSVKLYKGNSGNAGSTHLEIVPTYNASLNLDALVADPTDYSFWYWYSAVTANFVQFELKYEDPNSDGWIELTVVPHQNTLGTGAWLQKSLALTDSIGYGGVNELGTSFFDWDLGDTIAEAVTGPLAGTGSPVVGDWVLTRVRLELWEATPERTAYVDSVEIDGTVYTVEPGGTAAGMSLSSPFTDVGYTEDGVTIEYSAETTDLMVEEETLPIGRTLDKESVSVTCNMAESTLANIGNAMAGSVVSGNILTVGAGTLKTMNLRIDGTAPEGYKRQIFIPKATAIGTVGMSYRKGSKTIVPVTFQALKASGSSALLIVDNAA